MLRSILLAEHINGVPMGGRATQPARAYARGG